MKKILNLQVLALLVILAWFLPNVASTYIQPDEIGVRRSLLSGVADKDLDQGRALAIPMIHTIYRLPSVLHYQQYLADSALSLRTRENNVIDVDVTIIYEIVPGEGHLIVEEGFLDNYDEKAASVTQGLLREHLAQLTNQDVQVPARRVEVAESAVEPLNELLSQYHLRVTRDGVAIRAIRFRAEYEQKLQDKQLYAVQARLDEAKGKESEARTLTDTDEKGIDRDVKLEVEVWNAKIEEAKTEFEIAIADINADALKYNQKKRSEADAFCSEAEAEGKLAEAKAEALGKKLEAQALSSAAGRTYSAIEAARNFQLGDIELNSTDPRFLQDFGSMEAWRTFFLGSK
jgi:regulator of protease activity HflC (stomatin/prohibitin superfamily)